jgi:hypothetical protein
VWISTGRGCGRRSGSAHTRPGPMVEARAGAERDDGVDTLAVPLGWWPELWSGTPTASPEAIRRRSRTTPTAPGRAWVSPQFSRTGPSGRRRPSAERMMSWPVASVGEGVVEGQTAFMELMYRYATWGTGTTTRSARSTSRLEYPHSLSYHARTLTWVPSTTDVSEASKIDEYEDLTMSEETIGSSV